MKSWEKPVLSVLGVDKTKGISVFKVLSGVPLFEGETTEISDEDFVSIEGFNSNSNSDKCEVLNCSFGPGNHHGRHK